MIKNKKNDEYACDTNDRLHTNTRQQKQDHGTEYALRQANDIVKCIPYWKCCRGTHEHTLRLENLDQWVPYNSYVNQWSLNKPWNTTYKSWDKWIDVKVQKYNDLLQNCLKFHCSILFMCYCKPLGITATMIRIKYMKNKKK